MQSCRRSRLRKPQLALDHHQAVLKVFVLALKAPILSFKLLHGADERRHQLGVVHTHHAVAAGEHQLGVNLGDILGDETDVQSMNDEWDELQKNWHTPL